MIGGFLLRTVTAALSLLGQAGYRPIRRRRTAELRDREIRSVLVFNEVRGLGNLVLLTGLLANIRHLYPRAHIAVAMPSSPLAQSIIGKELADKLMFFEPADGGKRPPLRFAWQVLRPQRFELGLATFFSPTLLTSCMLALAGCRYRVAYAQARYRGFLNTITLLENGGHELDRHLRLLEFARQPLDRSTALVVRPSALSYARRLLEEQAMGLHRPLLGVHPGCDRLNGSKRWPLARFVSVINHVVNAGLADVVLFLGPDEADLFARLPEDIRSRALIVYAASLEHVTALISQCRTVLTNDSGLMHIAAALSVPTVAIFGPTDTTKNSPLGTTTLLVAHEVPCRPCYSASGISCTRDRRYCLEEIGIERVVSALRASLNAPALATPVAGCNTAGDLPLRRILQRRV